MCVRQRAAASRLADFGDEGIRQRYGEGLMKKTTFGILSVLFGLLCMPLWAQEPQPAYKNPDLPLRRRVNDLVSRMTLQEKVSQLGHTADAIPRLGVPQYDWWNEGLHGVARAGNATVFPQAIGMAAMFDEPMMRQIADAINTEFRAKYVERVHPDGSTDWYRGLTVWSPRGCKAMIQST